MDTFIPKNPYFEAVVRESFETQTYLKSIGAQLERVEPGVVDISAPYDGRFTQQDGYMHAAVTTGLVDVACGYASLSLMPEGALVLTVEFKMNFIRPARGEKFLAQGRVLKPGRTLLVCEGKCFAVEGGKSVLIAAMQATMIQV